MLRRVMGLGLTAAAVLLAPAVAHAGPIGSIAGWRTPLAGDMRLFVQAMPDPATGAALRKVTATLGPLDPVAASFVDGTCSQTCPAVVALTVTTLGTDGKPNPELPDGDYWLVVTIEDVNGATTEIRQMITVDNVHAPVTSSVTIQIGSGISTQNPSPPGNPGTPGTPGTPGPAPGCRAPKLSMRLADRPLRYRRGVPVLERGKTYRYAGRLTCHIDGRRRPAPRGMDVQVRNRLRGGRTVVKPSVEVRKAGEIVARLAYRSSRTIIFRVRGAGGELVRVRIPIRVVRR